MATRYSIIRQGRGREIVAQRSILSSFLDSGEIDPFGISSSGLFGLDLCEGIQRDRIKIALDLLVLLCGSVSTAASVKPEDIGGGDRALVRNRNAKPLD